MKTVLKEIILDNEELDWLDNGNAFCSQLDAMKRKEYNNIEWSVREKLKVLYTKEAELRNEYHIKLTQKEIDCIQLIFIDLTTEGYRFELQDLDNDTSKDLKPNGLDLTNSILKKLNKPILTIKKINSIINKRYS